MLNRTLLCLAVSLATSAVALGCGSGSSTTGGAGAAGAANGGEINGCTEAAATDETANSGVTIKFGGGFGLAYSPNCVKVKAGTVVTFVGDFSMHPLVGGTVGTSPTPDPKSPLLPKATGMSAAFTLKSAGTVPFYCANHFGSGMKGALFVQ